MGDGDSTRPVPRLPKEDKEPVKRSTSQISIGELENAAGYASVQMEAFSEAWQATLGRAVMFTQPEASRSTAAEISSALGGRHLVGRLAYSEPVAGECYLFLLEAEALIMAGLVSMLSDDEIDTKSSGALGEEDVSALTEVFSHAAANAGEALTAEFGERCALSTEEVFTAAPDSEMIERMIGPEPLIVTFNVQITGFESSRLFVAFTGDLAASFSPQQMHVTDTQILTVADRGDGKSLAEELGLPAGSPDEAAPAPVPAPKTPARRERSGEVDLDRVLQIELDVTVKIAEQALTVEEVLDMSPGMVLQLGVKTSDALGVYVNDHRVAEGSVVVKGERLALRLSDVSPPGDMVRSLG